MNKKDYELSAKITRLANRGAAKAISAALRAKLAIPFAMYGKMVYRLPDGKITDKVKAGKGPVRSGAVDAA